MKMTLLIAVLSTLTACSASTKSADTPVLMKLPPLPAELADCPAVGNLGAAIGEASTVGESQIIKLWGRDRANAVACRNRLKDLAAYYENLRSEPDRTRD